MHDGGIQLYIRYKTKINGKNCLCAFFRYRDGSSRIMCLKKRFFSSKLEEIFSTEDSFKSSEKVIEILSDTFTFGVRLPKYELLEIWEA